MNKRFLRCGLWLIGCGVLLIPLCDDPPLVGGPYVQDVTTDAAVVAKVTAVPRALSITVVDEDAAVVASLQEPVPVRRHRFQLRDLKPDARYHYTIRDASGHAVAHGVVKTAPDDDKATVRFAVVGDSGGVPWWVWLQRSPLFHLPARWHWFSPKPEVAAIGARIAAAHPDFMLHVGDVVYPWGQQGHYSAGFFRPFAGVLREAPVYPTVGNHDQMDDDGRQFFANFHLPVNEITGDSRCYSFAWGPLRVIALDCNVQLESDRLQPGHPTLEFARRELSARSEPWVIVMSHFPIRSASRQRDRADLLLELMPLLRANEADLYLCGHDHTYQRFGAPGDVPLVVTGGGGKSLYEVRMHAQVQVAQSQYHWCSIEVTPGRLLLRALGLDGSLIDTLDLRHDRDEARIERIRAVNPARAERIVALRR